MWCCAHRCSVDFVLCIPSYLDANSSYLTGSLYFHIVRVDPHFGNRGGMSTCLRKCNSRKYKSATEYNSQAVKIMIDTNWLIDVRSPDATLQTWRADKSRAIVSQKIQRRRMQQPRGLTDD